MALVHLPPSSPGVLTRGRGAVVAAFLAVAGGIHLQAAPEHVAEYPVFGLAFYAMATAQLLTASMFATGPASHRLRTATIVLSVGIAVLWAMTRIVGLPIGPEPWQPERVGLEDSLCTLFEVLAATVLLGSDRRQPASYDRGEASW